MKVVMRFWRSWFHQLHFKPFDPKQFMRGIVKKKKSLTRIRKNILLALGKVSLLRKKKTQNIICLNKYFSVN